MNSVLVSGGGMELARKLAETLVFEGIADAVKFTERENGDVLIEWNKMPSHKEWTGT